MSSQHVRPLMAFLLVSAICAMVMIHASIAAGLGQVVPHDFAIAGGAGQSAHSGGNGSSLGSLTGQASTGAADELVQSRVPLETGRSAAADLRPGALTSDTRIHASGEKPAGPSESSGSSGSSGHQPTTTAPPSGGASAPASGPARSPHEAKRLARAQHIRAVARAEYAQRVADAKTQRRLTQEMQSREVARARFERQIARAKQARDDALERAREIATGPGTSGAATADPVAAPPGADSSNPATDDPATGEAATNDTATDDTATSESVQ